MATMTYSTLTQDIKDWMENDGTEFSNETDNFISLAEQRISRDIEPYAFHETSYSSFNANDRFITKPTDALIIKHIIYLDSDSKRNYPVQTRRLIQIWLIPEWGEQSIKTTVLV